MRRGLPATQVELTLSWGSTVVRQASLCPPRAIYVGDEECAVPSAQLGLPRGPLLLVHDGEPCLAVWPGARGTVTLPGEAAQPLERLVAKGRAHPSPRGRESFEVPLPAGSSAEIVLGRAATQSVYRVPSTEDRLVAHLAVTGVPRRMLRRSAALRYASLAGLALSVLAHFLVFAGEPDPVLPPTAAQPPDPHEPVYTVNLPMGALAEREPDGDWDRIQAPLSADPNACDVCEWGCCYAVGTSSREYLTYARVRAPEPEGERERLFLVPAELSSCFTTAPHDVGWPPRARVWVERAGPLPSGDETRAPQPTPHGRLLGLLVVDDDDPVDEAAPLPSPRAPRPRHPRLAFRSQAVEAVERSLARAEPAFSWCYQRALEDHPGLSGRVTMRLGGPRGGVEAADTNVPDVELECCLANAQRLWAPRVYGDAELRYALDLQLQSDGVGWAGQARFSRLGCGSPPRPSCRPP
jgi:hypothetical protein